MSTRPELVMKNEKPYAQRVSKVSEERLEIEKMFSLCLCDLVKAVLFNGTPKCRSRARHPRLPRLPSLPSPAKPRQSSSLKCRERSVSGC